MTINYKEVTYHEGLEDKAYAALIGLAIGDSLGDQARSPENQILYGITRDMYANQSWSTDDTEFAILVAQELINSGGNLTENHVVQAWMKHVVAQDDLGEREAKAKKALQNLVLGKKVTIYPKYRDKYNRLIAIVLQEGLNVNEDLIESGHSWVHVYYCRDGICDRWKRLQDEARKKGQGLWTYENPVPPWRWKAIR